MEFYHCFLIIAFVYDAQIPNYRTPQALRIGRTAEAVMFALAFLDFVRVELL